MNVVLLKFLFIRKIYIYIYKKKKFKILLYFYNININNLFIYFSKSFIMHRVTVLPLSLFLFIY